MKKLVLVLTLAFPLPALAAEPVPMSKYCPKIAELAKEVMVARQNGTPMREMMEIADGEPIMVSMVTEAYGHPAYRTSAVQDRAIQEFENQWYLLCVKSYDL